MVFSFYSGVVVVVGVVVGVCGVWHTQAAAGWTIIYVKWYYDDIPISIDALASTYTGACMHTRHVYTIYIRDL